MVWKSRGERKARKLQQDDARLSRIAELEDKLSRKEACSSYVDGALKLAEPAVLENIGLQSQSTVQRARRNLALHSRVPADLLCLCTQRDLNFLQRSTDCSQVLLLLWAKIVQMKKSEDNKSVVTAAEELQNKDEELQSKDEELQSKDEELQSEDEELQSKHVCNWADASSDSEEVVESALDSRLYVRKDELELIMRESMGGLLGQLKEQFSIVMGQVRDCDVRLGVMESVAGDLERQADRLDSSVEVLEATVASLMKKDDSKLDLARFKQEMLVHNAKLRSEVEEFDGRLAGLAELAIEAKSQVQKLTSKTAYLERCQRQSSAEEVEDCREYVGKNSLATICGAVEQPQVNGKLVRMCQVGSQSDGMCEAVVVGARGERGDTLSLSWANLMLATCPSCYAGISSVNGCFTCGFGQPTKANVEEEEKKGHRGGKKRTKNKKKQDESGGDLVEGRLDPCKEFSHFGGSAGAKPLHSPRSIELNEVGHEISVRDSVRASVSCVCSVSNNVSHDLPFDREFQDCLSEDELMEAHLIEDISSAA